MAVHWGLLPVYLDVLLVTMYYSAATLQEIPSAHWSERYGRPCSSSHLRTAFFPPTTSLIQHACSAPGRSRYKRMMYPQTSIMSSMSASNSSFQPSGSGMACVRVESRMLAHARVGNGNKAYTGLCSLQSAISVGIREYSFMPTNTRRGRTHHSNNPRMSVALCRCSLSRELANN